ncbi:MAG: hypothetical protein LQ340_000600 [Diploschistes diacapsis]|nr:MAG: hypothetical protein LQ340_000600 [Diploschistes diacapsis]
MSVMSPPTRIERKSLDWELRSETSKDFLLGAGQKSQPATFPKNPKRLFIALTVGNAVFFIAAPIFDKGINFDLNESTMNRTLWAMDESTSIYIQDPSPEVDAAWEYISAYAKPIITIDRAEVTALGRDPDVIVKAPDEWNMGDAAYPAQINVFHDIHCLNMLRKEMVTDWNNINGVPVDEEAWRTIKRPDKAVVLPKATPNLYTPEDSEEWINSI